MLEKKIEALTCAIDRLAKVAATIGLPTDPDTSIGLPTDPIPADIDPQEEVDPITGEVPKKLSALTKEHVAAALTKVAQTPELGRQGALDILSRFGCKTLPELGEDKYAAFVRKCAEAVKGEPI